MSGAGKTTLGRAFYERIKPTCPHLVRLDGDQLRDVFANDVDHSIEGRRRNAARISNLCRLLDAQNIHVVASVLSIFPEWQEWNRRNFSAYFEIFLDIPLHVLKTRDTRGLYTKAEAGLVRDVVGVDIPFPRPVEPDLILKKTDEEQGVEFCIARILAEIHVRFPGSLDTP